MSTNLNDYNLELDAVGLLSSNPHNSEPPDHLMVKVISIKQMDSVIVITLETPSGDSYFLTFYTT